MEIELISPFPREHFATLWAWMAEFPSSNLDDGGPKNADELGKSLITKQQAGEKVYLVVYRGQPVGAIGYAQISPTDGMFRGVCFTRGVHGSGVAFHAVRLVLEKAFAGGTRTVLAYAFADNIRIRKFLRKFGATKRAAPGLPSARRNGKVVQTMVYGIRAHDFLCQMQRLDIRGGSSIEPEAIRGAA